MKKGTVSKPKSSGHFIFRRGALGGCSAGTAQGIRWKAALMPMRWGSRAAGFDLVPLCAFLLLLSGCWHEAFHAAVENGTGKMIYVVIHFDDKAIAPGHGDLEPGNAVSMPQRMDTISDIEYRVGDRRCRIDKAMIAKGVHPDAQGLPTITLRDCGTPAG